MDSEDYVVDASEYSEESSKDSKDGSEDSSREAARRLPKWPERFFWYSTDLPGF